MLSPRRRARSSSGARAGSPCPAPPPRALWRRILRPCRRVRVLRPGRGAGGRRFLGHSRRGLPRPACESACWRVLSVRVRRAPACGLNELCAGGMREGIQDEQQVLRVHRTARSIAGVCAFFWCLAQRAGLPAATRLVAASLSGPVDRCQAQHTSAQNTHACLVCAEARDHHTQPPPSRCCSSSCARSCMICAVFACLCLRVLQTRVCIWQHQGD